MKMNPNAALSCHDKDCCVPVFYLAKFSKVPCSTHNAKTESENHNRHQLFLKEIDGAGKKAKPTDASAT